MAKKYKIGIEMANGEKRYLGEHLLHGDPWSGMDRVVKQQVDDYNNVIAQKGHSEDLPDYEKITDQKTFNQFAGHEEPERQCAYCGSNKGFDGWNCIDCGAC